MMNGASTLEGYVPDVDATIVTRILDAGGTILGKAVCEYFCFSGGSHTSASGPVHNPRRQGYSAGGSSSGSAALVAAGEVDLAIGGDQGGSIRIPSAYCGIYGMKPTHGLVPYTGRDADRADDRPHRADERHRRRQRAAARGAGRAGRARPAPARRRGRPLYRGAGQGCSRACGSRSSPRASATPTPSRRSTPRCAPRPTRCEGSAPRSRRSRSRCTDRASPIWLPIAAEGATVQMMLGNGYGFNWKGLYVTSLLDFHSRLAEPRRRAAPTP